MLGLASRWETDAVLQRAGAYLHYSEGTSSRSGDSEQALPSVRVVADTSPLCYLLLIDQIDLLPLLFERVLIPRPLLPNWLIPRQTGSCGNGSPCAAWLEILEAPPTGAELRRLDAGEREAIALAEEVAADLVILDERKARQVALERGLSITGLLDFSSMLRSVARGAREVLDRLRQTSFRVDPKLLASLLDR